MDEKNQLEILKEDILKLYARRKNELDFNKINKLNEEIALKLKDWGKLRNKNTETAPLSPTL